MNVQLPVRLDKEAFLSWAQEHEERYELVDGRVVMMAGASLNHGRVVSNLHFALRRQLSPGWEVVLDFGLDSGPATLRCPDILVHQRGRDGTTFTTSEPVMLTEVLSPSSEALDLGDKASEYLQLPSLHAYLVLAQNEAKAWLWQRRDSAFVPGPTVIAGIDRSIAIDALAIDLSLAEIYRDVVVQN